MPDLDVVTVGRIALLGALAAGILLLSYGFSRPLDPGAVALRRYFTSLATKAEFLRLRIKPSRIISAQCVAIVLMIGLALYLFRWEPVALSLVAIPLPWAMLEKQVSDRIIAIESQTDIWLGALANALRASPSLGEGIASTIAITEAPLCHELETLMKDYELGTPLDEALANLGQRCRSNVMDACLQALRVARKSGGNLPETLESAAAALRELARLEGVVRTKTAEGKMQAMVIGFLPIPVVSAINWIDPAYLAPMWETFFGNLLVGVAIVIWIVAILLARKICSVDV